jgi:hypothetical protein
MSKTGSGQSQEYGSSQEGKAQVDEDGTYRDELRRPSGVGPRAYVVPERKLVTEVVASDPELSSILIDSEYSLQLS